MKLNESQNPPLENLRLKSFRSFTQIFRSLLLFGSFSTPKTGKEEILYEKTRKNWQRDRQKQDFCQQKLCGLGKNRGNSSLEKILFSKEQSNLLSDVAFPSDNLKKKMLHITQQPNVTLLTSRHIDQCNIFLLVIFLNWNFT